MSVAGINMTFATKNWAATAADSSYFANHLPTSVPPSAEQSGTGSAYTQLPCKKLLTRSPAALLEASSWLQATTIAPMNAPAKQPKNTADETGIGTFMMMSATMAAQKGRRFRIADMMIGWASLRPKLYKSSPVIPTANMTASFA